jgi:hypothetical protein
MRPDSGDGRRPEKAAADSNQDHRSTPAGFRISGQVRPRVGFMPRTIGTAAAQQGSRNVGGDQAQRYLRRG